MVARHAATIALGIAFASMTTAANVAAGELTHNITTSSHASPEAESDLIISLCGVDLVGGDLWNARAPNPDTCIGLCTPQSGCDAATWTNYEGGTCWLKRLGGWWSNSKASVGAASFLRIPANGGSGYQGPEFPANIDMPGHDIGNVPAATAYECRRRCVTNAFCFAYVYTNYNGGTCWFKSQASPFVPSSGAVGEYLFRVTNPDTCLTYP